MKRYAGRGGNRVDDGNEPGGSVVSLERIVSLVETRVLTEMDGRDLLRCQATEKVCDVDVFCVSLERGAVYRNGRHLDANFNGRKFVQQLKNHIGECDFDQIILDYFWIPRGWDEDHWKRSFFSKTLPALAQAHVLTANPSYSQHGGERYRKGVIYLPFCFHCLKEIVALYGALSVYYNVSFLRRSELGEITLWKGTQSLDRGVMSSIFRKKLSQEEIYCIVTEQQIRSMEDEPSITKAEMVQFVNKLGPISEIRFIVLEVLPT
jgi:hypothetical protein